MKTRPTFFSILIAATCLIGLTNCSGNKNDDSANASGNDASTTDSSDSSLQASAPQFQVDAEFQKQLGNVFSSYVSLKDAFVASDPAKVKTEAATTTQALSKVDMKLVSGAAHNDWMNYLTPIQSSLADIQSAADIEAQRKSFSILSDNLYKSIRAFGLGGREAFYEFCPMAFNNEGAYWLSEQSQIRNPYFGDKMLTCGEVKEKLK